MPSDKEIHTMRRILSFLSRYLNPYDAAYIQSYLLRVDKLKIKLNQLVKILEFMTSEGLIAKKIKTDDSGLPVDAYTITPVGIKKNQDIYQQASSILQRPDSYGKTEKNRIKERNRVLIGSAVGLVVIVAIIVIIVISLG